MRRQKWFAVLLVAGMIGLVVEAAEKPTAEYQKAMKDLGAFAAGIDKAITAEDYETIQKLAVSAREAFAVAEAYWTGRSEEAKQWAGAGGKSAADLNVVAGFKSKEGVEFSASEVKGSCAACHTAHREAQPDGSFLIK
jgi:mono/diheme cytochrome c family protein